MGVRVSDALWAHADWQKHIAKHIGFVERQQALAVLHEFCNNRRLPARQKSAVWDAGGRWRLG